MKTFTHEIDIPLPAARAFPLFTPRGEEDWVPGWMPRYLAPEDGETAQGMIFTTGEGGDQTIWTCLEWEPDLLHARYFRAVPGNRVSIVDVRCAARSDTQTAVAVSYSHAALGAEGQAYIDAITDETYAAGIEEWRTLIEKAFLQ